MPNKTKRNGNKTNKLTHKNNQVRRYWSSLGHVSRNSYKYCQLYFVEMRMYLFLGQQHVLLGQYLNGNIINDMYC